MVTLTSSHTKDVSATVGVSSCYKRGYNRDSLRNGLGLYSSHPSLHPMEQLYEMATDVDADCSKSPILTTKALDSYY